MKEILVAKIMGPAERMIMLASGDGEGEDTDGDER